jgi:hypothetical protein
MKVLLMSNELERMRKKAVVNQFKIGLQSNSYVEWLRKPTKISIRMTRPLAEIWFRNLQNTKQEC